MGRITARLKRLFGNKGALTFLPPGQGEQIDEQAQNEEKVSKNEEKSFKESIKAPLKSEVEMQEQKSEIVIENMPQYNPTYMTKTGFWYTNKEIRQEYYDGIETEYDGALEIYLGEDKNIIVKCRYTDEKQQEYEIELGKVENSKKRFAMRNIDNIIALQVAGMKNGADYDVKIQIICEDLKKAGFKFSVLGEQILSYSGKEPFELPSFKPDTQYGIDFSNLETTESVYNFSCIIEEAVLDPKKVKEETEKYIELCELAIDIGCIDVEDWRRIDGKNYEFRRYDMKKYNEPGTVLYERQPSGKIGSYNSLAQTFFKPQSKLDKATRKSLKEKNQTMAYYRDEKENIIRKITREKIIWFAAYLNKYIEAYKTANPLETRNINLLNDMVCFLEISQFKQQDTIVGKKTLELKPHEERDAV